MSRTIPDRPTAASALWGLPVALLIVVVIGTIGANHSRPALPQLGSAALAVMAGLGALAATRWPRAALVAVPAAVAGYFITGGAEGPIFLTPAVTAYLAALVRPARALVGPALAGTLLLLLGQTGRVAVNGYPAWVAGWQTVGTVALAGAAAAVGWWRTARREARAERVRRAATEEQLRVARDLHDGVGHGLAVIAMQAGVALHVLEQDPGAVRNALVSIRDTSRESLGQLRAELTTLVGEQAQRSPQRGLADLSTSADRVRAAGLDVRLQLPDRALPGPLDHVVHAIITEAMTNALRHADARSLDVVVEQPGDTVVVTISDDGRGPTSGSGGMGLRAMAERVAALGGTLSTGPGSLGGFRVHAVLPCLRESAR